MCISFNCMSKALEDNYLVDKKVIHISPTDYSLDQANGITNPLGMFGNELEINFLILPLALFRPNTTSFWFLPPKGITKTLAFFKSGETITLEKVIKPKLDRST